MNVVLVHGLYMPSLVMWVLGERLQQAGFTPHYFGYATTRLPLRAQAARLAQFVRQRQLLPCHFVGHSLGGLLLRHLAAGYPDLLQQRVVTLGSPHQGSAAAKCLQEYYAPLLGAAWQDGLDGHVPSGGKIRAWGNIRGSRNMGAGRLLGVDAHSDGTVALTEAVLPHSEMLTLPCTHTGLLLDKTVARQTAYFLQHGCFESAC